jgi:predicted ester cyclase
MYAEDNKAICRRFIQKIFNEGELSLLRDFMTPDAVNHELQNSLGPGPLPQGSHPHWMAELIDLYRYAFPDLHFEIQSQIAEGDRVVTSLRMRGTHENPLMTIKPSGRKVDVTGIRIDRFAGGKIAESWYHFDALTMLRQLDAVC